MAYEGWSLSKRLRHCAEGWHLYKEIPWGHLQVMIDAADELERLAPRGWRPMSTAPRGVPVLLLTNAKWADCRPSTQFVGINRDDLCEWSFYAPVGMGGIPDAWLDGWQPLPPPPTDAAPAAPGEGATAEK